MSSPGDADRPILTTARHRGHRSSRMDSKSPRWEVGWVSHRGGHIWVWKRGQTHRHSGTSGQRDTSRHGDMARHRGTPGHGGTSGHTDTSTEHRPHPLPSPRHSVRPTAAHTNLLFSSTCQKKRQSHKEPHFHPSPPGGAADVPPHPPFLIRPRQEMGGSAPHAAPLSLPHHSAPPKLRTANAPHKPPQCPTVVGGTATSGAHPGVPDVPTLRTPRLQGAGNHMSPEMRKCFDFVFTLLGGAHPIHPSPEHF